MAEGASDRDGTGTGFEFNDRDFRRACRMIYTRAGIVLTDFSLGQPSLDEVFLALTGRPTEEADDTEEERVV